MMSAFFYFKHTLSRLFNNFIKFCWSWISSSKSPALLRLTNFEIQKYYKNESKFNGVYSRDNVPDETKNEAYAINLDKYSDIGIYWVALYVSNNVVTYFDSFGVEHIPKEIKNLLVIQI